MKPMLACSKLPNLEDLMYPKIASYKLDGIRCLIIDGTPMSRNMKPIPNEYVRQVLSDPILEGFDGELMLADRGDFNSVQSAFMSHDGRPDFIYWVFDHFSNPQHPYRQRFYNPSNAILTAWPTYVKPVTSWVVNSHHEVEDNFARAIDEGYEGLILREPDSPYKHGRSTMRQEYMLKVKAVNDMEGTVIDTVELFRNTDTSSKKQDNLYGAGVLGALVLDIGKGLTVKVGTGFDMKTRAKLWAIRKGLLGEKVTFSYQELSKYGIPRFTVFKGFRYDI